MLHNGDDTIDLAKIRYELQDEFLVWDCVTESNDKSTPTSESTLAIQSLSALSSSSSSCCSNTMNVASLTLPEVSPLQATKNDLIPADMDADKTVEMPEKESESPVQLSAPCETPEKPILLINLDTSTLIPPTGLGVNQTPVTHLLDITIPRISNASSLFNSSSEPPKMQDTKESKCERISETLQHDDEFAGSSSLPPRSTFPSETDHADPVVVVNGDEGSHDYASKASPSIEPEQNEKKEEDKSPREDGIGITETVEPSTVTAVDDEKIPAVAATTASAEVATNHLENNESIDLDPPPVMPPQPPISAAENENGNKDAIQMEKNVPPIITNERQRSSVASSRRRPSRVVSDGGKNAISKPNERKTLMPRQRIPNLSGSLGVPRLRGPNKPSATVTSATTPNAKLTSRLRAPTEYHKTQLPPSSLKKKMSNGCCNGSSLKQRPTGGKLTPTSVKRPVPSVSSSASKIPSAVKAAPKNMTAAKIPTMAKKVTTAAAAIIPSANSKKSHLPNNNNGTTKFSSHIRSPVVKATKPVSVSTASGSFAVSRLPILAKKHSKKN